MDKKRPLFFVKLLNYEYWPWWAIYLPITPYILYQAWRAKSLTYFTAANPFIEMGGFFGESKINILNQIAEKYKPKTVFFDANTTADTILKELKNQSFDFPVIAKPNIGERGTQVAKIENEIDFLLYLKGNNGGIIIQEFVDFEIELGVLYYRLPNEATGQITSLTLKEFLTVTGNGQSTIEELMRLSDRARLQIASLRSRLGNGVMQEVLPNAEKRLLEPIGNHCRGTKFIDVNTKITPQLNQVFDAIAADIPDFHFGRFDLRVKTWADLYAGQNIRIVELNGASSEPGHIYDPNHKLLRAYTELAKHWRILADICIEQRKKGIFSSPLADVWAMTKQHLWS